MRQRAGATGTTGNTGAGMLRPPAGPTPVTRQTGLLMPTTQNGPPRSGHLDRAT